MHKDIKVTQKEGMNFVETTVEVPFGEGKTLSMTTGKLAKQANGAVIARIGGTVVLAAVTMADKPTDKDFFPLMVDYREKFYASGRIPGGFFKREARPSDGETLRARMTDRTLRPMFPTGFKNEVIVFITVLGMDNENAAELVAMCATGAALHISDIPFQKPIAGTRVGMIDGKIVVNPTMKQYEELQMDLIVAGHRDAINMVEAGAKECSEQDLVNGLNAAHDQIKLVCEAIEVMREKAGKEKAAFEPVVEDKDLRTKIEKMAVPHIKEILVTFEKKAREKRVKQAITEIMEKLGEDFIEREPEVSEIFNAIDEREMRKKVIEAGVRADGRRPTEIRPIWGEVDPLPSVHGSAIFTRGQTQALAIATLGSIDDMQMIDNMHGVTHKRFFLHYNFPGFSVGEARAPRGPGRREIGHGALAERAVEAILPPKEEFPYTLRAVVEILESNGSSSMATVCSTCMALMDAGVPVKRPVAGIAMGLIASEDGKKFSVLSDIQGIEDHCGDMDFKVCGTSAGVTALQMDIKIEGVTNELLAQALEQARVGRLHILGKMSEVIAEPRAEMKPHAPRMVILKVPVDNIRDIIGSGGKVIRGIQEATGAKIDIEDDGTVYVTATSGEASDAAIAAIDDIIREIEEGEIFTGKVVRVMESGAIVQLTSTKDGMIHISALDHKHVEKVEDVVNVGDEVTVKVIEVDKARGRIRLSRKAMLERPEGMPERPERPHGGGDRGDRGGDRGGFRGNRGGGDRDRRPAGVQGGGGDGGRPRRPRPPRSSGE